ncbi:MAG: hypothetical protein QOF12_2015, partial [Solirubrobacteraceae bacterium]|nr:hypothetical protein [Solirubrobacteraceae bacterium]
MEEIGRLTARHPSTVGYWLRHHGLVAAGSARYSARGPLAREVLQQMVEDRLTLREMAERSDRSISTVRYWLKCWGIARATAAPRAPADPATAPRIALMSCTRHGTTEFVL